ncbi:hypothetical protein [Candidatus Palauibacter sp.]|uniref:hypothetical protein n=1 Tax=Candidatus Palauibacter sp. TaxID=3101350 RepID=UPI003B01ADF9
MRALRGLAALTVAGLAVAAVWAGLRSLGFRPRWEVEAPPPRPAPQDVRSRMPPPLSPQAVAPDEPAAGGEGDPSPSGEGRVATYPPARIDFETYGDGRPVRSNAAVAGEWRERGLVLSFESYTADAVLPHVLDAGGYLPPHAPSHALGPPLSGDRGLEVGVIHLDFPGRPRRVAFTLFGPDLIDRFEVIVRSRGERLPPSAADHSPDARYGAAGNADSGKATYNPGGRSLFRAERVVVEVAAGVDRISLDGWGPPGHILLLDHLEIDP